MLKTKEKKWMRWAGAGLGVFAIAAVTGFVAGNLVRNNDHEAEAASANITVTDNDQTVTVDQSTSLTTLTKTSIVTVKDTTATTGYTLGAKLSQNTLPSSTVTIGSASSTSCTVASPCTLNTTTPVELLSTTSSAATGGTGETTTWTVKITVPANTPLANYIVDIEYSQDAKTPLGLTDGGNMQDSTKAQCTALAMGSTVNLKDTRDNKVYRVRKMADGNCWMADNLAFALANGSTGVPAFSPAAALIAGSTTSVQTQAQYISNTGYNTAAGQTTYLYNWCAALGDTSTNCAASVAATTNNTVIGGVVNTTGTTTSQPAVTGICPAPFRLPKGGPAATSSTAATTANEFAGLDIAMGGTGANRTSANTYPNFMANNNSDATGKSWSGVLGGLFGSGFNGQGTYGYWWSSTASNTSGAYILYLYSSSSIVYPANNNGKNLGFAVRCVL